MTATQSNIVRILQSAREIIADPARWTKNAVARNAAGKEVPASHPEAVCWCVTGAIGRVTGYPDIERYRALKVLQNAQIYDIGAQPQWTTIYNDFFLTTHADILRLFDAAIVRAEKEKS